MLNRIQNGKTIFFQDYADTAQVVATIQ
jgi:hypothetical protein